MNKLSSLVNVLIVLINIDMKVNINVYKIFFKDYKIIYNSFF